MKTLLRNVLAVVVLGVFALQLRAQEDATSSAVQTDLEALIQRINTKLEQGETSAAALEPELAEFDVLLKKHRESNPEEAAAIPFTKALLYMQVLGDREKAMAVLRQLKEEFPSSKPAAIVDQLIAQEEQRAESDREKARLVGQPAPEITFTWANVPELDTLSSRRGKVVVLDFWATWCGPCVKSFPQIKELADYYQGFDVEIIGVTSLQGRVMGLGPQPIDCRGDPEKEHGLMTKYIEAHDINWTIAFSEQPVFNEDYAVNGIPHMTIVAPDGTIRHNGIHPGGVPLQAKVKMIDALLEEAGLRTPGTPAKS